MVCVQIIILWMVCNCVFWQQDILIVIVCTLNSQMLLKKFVIFLIFFSQSVRYGNTTRHIDCIKITSHTVWQQTVATFQDWHSVRIYSAIILQSISNSELKVFRKILGNCNKRIPWSLSGSQGEVYDNLYSGTDGEVDLGWVCSLELFSSNYVICWCRSVLCHLLLVS